MPDAFNKIIALILALLLLYVFPVENMLTRQDDITRIVVFNETTEFVDSVRNLGYLTPLMYLQFSEALTATGNQFDISLEHRHESIDPSYADPAVSTSFQQDYGNNIRAVYTDEILETLFPQHSQSSGGYYYLSRGDTFSVEVSNRNKTIATQVQEMLFMTDLPAKRIILNYGGMVRDENH